MSSYHEPACLGSAGVWFMFLLYWHSTAKYSQVCVEPLFSVVFILFWCVGVCMFFKLSINFYKYWWCVCFKFVCKINRRIWSCVSRRHFELMLAAPPACINRSTAIPRNFMDWISPSTGVMYLRLINLQCTYIRRKNASLVEIVKQGRGISLDTNELFGLYFAFHSSDVNETPHLAMYAHALQSCMFGWNRTIMKGALLGENSTLSFVSGLPFEWCNSDSTPRTLCECGTNSPSLVEIGR